jgi:hypothetical protein
MHRNLFGGILLALSVLLSSCLTDEVAPNIFLRAASGDTIQSDTIQVTLNSTLTLVSVTTDDQDLREVLYYQGFPEGLEQEIPYSDGIQLTNRIREVFVDLPFPDSIFEAGGVSSFRVMAEDNAGNVSELFKLIRIQ